MQQKTTDGMLTVSSVKVVNFQESDGYASEAWLLRSLLSFKDCMNGKLII